jgi:hypothetical protein
MIARDDLLLFDPWTFVGRFERSRLRYNLITGGVVVEGESFQVFRTLA